MKDIFQVVFLASEIGHFESAGHQQAQKLVLGCGLIGHAHLPDGLLAPLASLDPRDPGLCRDAITGAPGVTAQCYRVDDLPASSSSIGAWVISSPLLTMATWSLTRCTSSRMWVQ